MNFERPTIAAIATPPGFGERAIVRLSGARAKAIARLALVPSERELPLLGRGFTDARFDDGRGEQPARVSWMSAPRSYTGEDVIEFHLPGSPPLVARALARLLELGAELARPGEFTRRAFENGRIDLARAEGVLAMVSAQNREELAAARSLFFGGLGSRLAELREELDSLRALCVASLDFVDDDAGHVPERELQERADRALARLASMQHSQSRRERTPGLPRVVLAGRPNAGKSSLFNRLAGARALVAHTAGTTRDPLSAEARFGEFDATLFDTPGVDDGRGDVERSAQELARELRGAADLVVWVLDGSLRERALEQRPSFERELCVWNKLDQSEAAVLARLAPDAPQVSARDGTGLERLRAAIAERLRTDARSSGVGRELAERHARGLQRASAELQSARTALEDRAPLDLVAESLRTATDALDELSGATTSDDLLERIFARFCVGK